MKLHKYKKALQKIGLKRSQLNSDKKEKYDAMKRICCFGGQILIAYSKEVPTNPENMVENLIVSIMSNNSILSGIF